MRLFLLLFASAGLLPLVGQGRGSTPLKTPIEGERPPATPKELASQLLGKAFDAIGSASAGVQPDLLWRVSDCYTLLDKKKARNALEQAFADAGSSQGFSNPGPGVQGQVAVSMSEIDLPRSAEMVRSIPGAHDWHVWSFDPRTSAVTRIIDRMLSKQDIDAAIGLIHSLSSDGAFPYEAVSSILSALKAENDPRRVIIFGDAITAYQTRPARPFGQMLAKHWRQLPRASVVQALDSIVNTVAAYKDGESTYKIAYIGKKGSSELGSEQEVELFDIAEPLRECQPAKAREIFDNHPALKRASEQFPEGPASKDIGGMTMAMGPPGGSQKNMARNEKNEAFAANIVLQRQAIDTAARDFNAGLSKISALANSDLRAGALIEAVQARAESDPAIARSLLRKALDALAESKDPESAYQILNQAFGVAERLKDEPLLSETLNRSFDAAAELYAIDADAGDPNAMPMNMWPSADAYRGAIREAKDLYGMKAVSYLDRIKNPDL